MNLNDYTKYEFFLGRKIGDWGYVDDHHLEIWLREWSKQFDFTVQKTRGCYKGVWEEGIVLTHLWEFEKPPGPDFLKKIADSYKQTFSQDSVLLTVSSVKGSFL